MRILVTGGAGFIGSNLVRQLKKDGVQDVVVIDDLTTGYESNLDGLDVEFHHGSILDPVVLAAATSQVDSIVHLAARPSVPRSIADPMASHHANATGTMCVLEAARLEDAHVVLASSSSVYGANPAIPKHETLRPMPMSPYAVSKLATEAYALAYQEVFGLSVLPFRFFNVYGPGQSAGHAYAAVVPEFLNRALRGERLLIHGDGLQTRDFTFVDSVTQVLSMSARDRVSSPDSVNLAFGERRSLLDLVALIEKDIGFTLAIQHVETRVGDVRDSQADGSCLRQLFPDASPVDLSVGVHATMAWMRQQLLDKA